MRKTAAEGQILFCNKASWTVVRFALDFKLEPKVEKANLSRANLKSRLVTEFSERKMSATISFSDFAFPRSSWVNL